MKQKFSKHWKSSKQPRKQRKYLANAPLNVKRKFVSVSLSKELRKKHGKRNIPVRKGDVVKIMKGKFKKKQGKVTKVELKKSKIIVEGIQIKKTDGSKVNAPLRASNLQIIELNLEDKKRFKRMKKILGKEIKKETEKEKTKEIKKELKEKPKNEVKKEGVRKK